MTSRFSIRYRFPLDERQEQELRTFAASPNEIAGTPDTLTMGEVTILVDGEVVRPPWASSEQLPFTDSEWLYGLFTQLGSAALGLKTGERRRRVSFMDDPLAIDFERTNGQIRITVVAERGSGVPGLVLAKTSIGFDDFMREVRGLVSGFSSKLNDIDSRILRHPPFDKLDTLGSNLG